MAKKEEIQHDCEHCHARYKSIFCQIAPDEVKIINENKWCQSLEKGQQLFAEGAYPHGIFCVNTGKIKIHQMELLCFDISHSQFDRIYLRET